MLVQPNPPEIIIEEKPTTAADEKTAIEAVKEVATPTSIPPKKEFPPDYIYQGEVLSYEGEPARIINEVKERFGVELLSPVTLNSESEVVENVPWNTREIATVAEAISQLPPAYLNSERAPIQILLYKACQVPLLLHTLSLRFPGQELTLELGR